MNCRLVVAIGAGWAMAGAAGAWGSGFENTDLSLRFPAALSRFSPYADVAGTGGASGASPWFSGINPASTSWKKWDDKYSLSLQYSALLFSEGTDIHVVAESFGVDAGNIGQFQPAAQVVSNTATTKQGLTFDLDLQLYQVQWSKRVENWAVGFNFNYSPSTLDLGLPAPISMDAAKTVGDTYDFRFGGLYEAVKDLRLGLVVDYAFTPAITRVSFPAPMEIHDTTQQVLMRSGVSWEYLKDSSLYFDYQLGYFSNSTGNLATNRFFMGVDHRIVDWFFVRGGFAIDTRGNPSYTAGVGIYPVKNFSIDVAYQLHMFPELEPELGQSQTATISVAYSF